MHFAERFAMVLESRSISAYKVSKGTGLSDGLLSNYRTGKNDPSAENLIKIADWLNVSVDYLLGRTENPEVNR